MHTSQRSLSHLTVPIFLAVLMAFAISHPVTANHGYLPIGSSTCLDPPNAPRNCVSTGYDNNHLVHFVSLGVGFTNATLNTMNEDYSPTDLNMIQTSVPSHADVKVYDTDYGQNGVAGWVDCPADAPQGINGWGHRWCKGQTLKYNLSPVYSAYWNDAASRAHTACHEMGHTVGLFHFQNTGSCMHGDWYYYYPSQEGPSNLHPWDVNELNWYYPPY